MILPFCVAVGPGALLLWVNLQFIFNACPFDCVTGPFTIMCGLFVQHRIRTNTAVGTMWLALSKPPQKWQSTKLCPLWLLVYTPTALGPLTHLQIGRRTGCSSADVTWYFWYITIKCKWPLWLGWLLVLRLYIPVYGVYLFVLLIEQPLRESGRLGSLIIGWPYRLNYYYRSNWRSWFSPQSLLNRAFCSIFVLIWLCTVCRLGVFVIRLRQISTLFLLGIYNVNIPMKF